MLSELFGTLKTFFDSHSTQLPKRLNELEVHPRERVFWDPVKKEIGTARIPPRGRSHTVRDLPSLVALIAYAREHQTTYGGPEPTGEAETDSKSTAAVWIDAAAIRVVFDDTEEREHFAALPFTKTPLWNAIEALHKRPEIEQTEAIRLLRTTLQEFDSNSDALTACKNLTLTTTTGSESEVNHTNKRMSRAVQQEAAGGGKLPETLKVLALPYLGLTWPDADGDRNTFAGYPIEIFLEVDFDNEGFRFEPNEQHVHDAQQFEALRLQSLLTEQLAEVGCANVPVFIGSSGDAA